MATTNLQAPDMADNQQTPYLTHNEANDILDAAVGGILIHNMASDADYTLDTATGSAPYEWQNMVINITDTGVVLTTTRNILIPDYPKVYMFVNGTAQSLVLVPNASPLTGVTVAAGKSAILYYNGTSVIRITDDTA